MEDFGSALKAEGGEDEEEEEKLVRRVSRKDIGRNVSKGRI